METWTACSADRRQVHLINRGRVIDVFFQNRVVARLIEGLSGGGTLGPVASIPHWSLA